MQYIFETKYNQESLTVMAKCLRKTVRKKKSKRSHIFGWLVVLLALLFTFISSEEDFVIDLRKIITWIAGISIVIALIFEDYLNGYFARKQMLKGTEKAVAVFDTERTDAFVSETEVGKSEFAYDKVALAAETERYFVFVFSENHAQVYDKESLSGGTVNEFKDFISKAINKEIVVVR